MRSVSLQQHVVLAVQLPPRDQSPCLVAQRPTQSVFPNWKQKNRVVAHRHQVQMFQNTHKRVPTVFREEMLRQCFTQ